VLGVRELDNKTQKISLALTDDIAKFLDVWSDAKGFTIPSGKANRSMAARDILKLFIEKTRSGEWKLD